jgi:hypothetical protein
MVCFFELVDPGRSFPTALLSPSAPQFGGVSPRATELKKYPINGIFFELVDPGRIELPASRLPR